MALDVGGVRVRGDVGPSGLYGAAVAGDERVVARICAACCGCFARLKSSISVSAIRRSFQKT